MSTTPDPSTLEDQDPKTDPNIESETDPKIESEGIKNLRNAYNKTAAELKKYKEAEALANQKKLEEEGNYKQLIAEKDAKIEELSGKLTKTERTSTAEKELRKSGASEEAIDLLIDSIVAHHDWDKGDIAEAVKSVKEKRPSLFNTVTHGSIGAGKSTQNLSSEQQLKSSTDDSDLEALYQSTKK